MEFLYALLMSLFLVFGLPFILAMFGKDSRGFRLALWGFLMISLSLLFDEVATKCENAADYFSNKSDETEVKFKNESADS